MTDPADPTDEFEEVNEVETTEPTPRLRDDDNLLAELGHALTEARQPNEDRVIADAQDAFSFLAVQDEFAELVFDSLWEDKLETTSRASTNVRSLVFESMEVSLEIEVGADGVYGQLTPPQSASIEAERSDGSRLSVHTDPVGSFTLTSTGSGPVRFHVLTGRAVTITEWINLPA